MLKFIKRLFDSKKSKFAHLENLDAANLQIEIIKMSIKDKAEMLFDIFKYKELTQNNIRVAIVIQIHLTGELESMLVN